MKNGLLGAVWSWADETSTVFVGWDVSIGVLLTNPVCQRRQAGWPYN